MQNQTLNATPLICLIVSALVALLFSGCGSAKYEERLQNAVQYHEYQANLNSHLHQRDIFLNGSLSYRAPLQFKAVSPPNLDDYDEEGELKPGKKDLRQPAYIPGMQFEGLQATWQTSFATKKGKSGKSGRSFSGYLYLLTNREHFGDDDLKEKAEEFSNKTIADLANTLHTSVPDKLDWTALKAPQNALYSKQVHFDVTTLQSKESVLGVSTNVRIYRHQAGEIQSLLIFVLPRPYEEGKKNAPDQLLKRMKLSLETFLADSKKPSKNDQNGLGGGGGGDF